MSSVLRCVRAIKDSKRSELWEILGTMYATFEMRNGLQQSASLTGTEQYYLITLYHFRRWWPVNHSNSVSSRGRSLHSSTGFLLFNVNGTSLSLFLDTLLILVFPSKRPAFVISALPRFSNALSMHHRRQKVLISRTLL
jgi:hypothetical protein